MIIAIVLSTSGFSQQKKDSIIDKKNELSIDLIPAARLLSDLNKNHIYSYRESIQYKRALKSRFFLRFGIAGSQERNVKKFSNIRIEFTDSLVNTVTYEEHQHKPELRLSAGFEYRWGKRRIKHFTGIDLSFVHSKSINSNYLEAVPYYNYDPNVYDPDIVIVPISATHTRNYALINSYSSTSNGICLSPFYGIQYHFSGHFFFSMQLGVGLQILERKNKAILNNPDFISNSEKKTDTGIAPGGFLNNFSLAYRF